jgi:acyl dehydratase
MTHLEDLPLGTWFPCGSFRLTRAEIIAFAQNYDPQPFHLDDAAAEASYFGRLCASGLHTQGMAIGLMVRAIADVAVVAGYSLNQARFLEPTWPDTDYAVRAAWTEASPSPRNPARGRATIAVEVAAQGRPVATLGVTYVVARRIDPLPACPSQA